MIRALEIGIETSLDGPLTLEGIEALTTKAREGGAPGLACVEIARSEWRGDQGLPSIVTFRVAWDEGILE